MCTDACSILLCLDSVHPYPLPPVKALIHFLIFTTSNSQALTPHCHLCYDQASCFLSLVYICMSPFHATYLCHISMSLFYSCFCVTLDCIHCWEHELTCTFIPVCVTAQALRGQHGQITRNTTNTTNRAGLQ